VNLVPPLVSGNEVNQGVVDDLGVGAIAKASQLLQALVPASVDLSGMRLAEVGLKGRSAVVAARPVGDDTRLATPDLRCVEYNVA